MRPATEDATSSPPRPTPPESVDLEFNAARQEEVDRREPRNFAVIAWYQIVIRVGWIFKTESIIMPAFLDYIGGSAWLRGCLPVLNRFGQSVPPLLFARRIKIIGHKKLAVATCMSVMACAFISLAVIWWAIRGEATPWMPYVFLVIYALFFIATGMHQLAMGTLQGKLIQPTHRGRLMTVSTTIGAPAAILCAWLLLPQWLGQSRAEFTWIFGFTAALFIAGAMSIFAVSEPADDYEEEPRPPAHLFREAWRLVGSDWKLRRLVYVAMCFSSSLMLFPHYQALARERLGLSFGNLMLWVVVQNAGTMVFSLIAGPLADRKGTRLALRGCIFACASSPLLATSLTLLAPDVARRFFWLVFVPVGLTPITFRTLINHALEISKPADHPRYLSTLGICLAMPVLLLAPLVGGLTQIVGFEPVFLSAACVLLLGGAMTYRLAEPREPMKTTAEISIEE